MSLLLERPKGFALDPKGRFRSKTEKELLNRAIGALNS